MPTRDEKNFKDAGETLLKRIESNVRGVAIEIHANLVDTDGGTPRDTGWAANNWVAQLRTVFRGLVGSPKNVSSTKSESAAGTISKWKSGSGPIFVSNNVPYIQRLNAGSSSQAPAGFVEKAVQRAVNRFGTKKG